MSRIEIARLLAHRLKPHAGRLHQQLLALSLTSPLTTQVLQYNFDATVFADQQDHSKKLTIFIDPPKFLYAGAPVVHYSIAHYTILEIHTISAFEKPI